ncbi:Zinc finger, CCHC-type [Phytophthora cactorum]|nr:Zinc finger, CCHC-type [Phytophthora cactorum]
MRRLTGLLEHFANQVSGAAKKQRRPYTCSRCGDSDGHNAARCPSRAPVDAPAGSEIVGVFAAGDVVLLGAVLLRRGRDVRARRAAGRGGARGATSTGSWRTAGAHATFTILHFPKYTYLI